MSIKSATIGVPAGLGDIHWVMTIMESFKSKNKIERLKVVVSQDGCHTNSLQFLQLLPFVNEVENFPRPLRFDFTKKKSRRKTIKIKAQPFIDYLIEFNSKLEDGVRIENILPQYKVNFNYPILMDSESALFAKDIRKQVGGKLVLLYSSSNGMFRAWTKDTWFPIDWVRLSRMIYERTQSRLVLIGKEWDTDYTNEIKRHDTDNIIFNLTCKTDVPQVLALIALADLFIGFPSGLTILSTKFKTPVAMFWSIKNITPKGVFLPKFQHCWVDPEVTNAGLYMPFAYGDENTRPEKIFQKIERFL